VLRRRKLECTLIYYMFNACSCTAPCGIRGSRMKSYRYSSPEADIIIQNHVRGMFPDLRDEWKRVMSHPDPSQAELLRLLQATATEFRASFKITKPGLRKQGYRDLSLINKEEELKVCLHVHRTYP